MAAETSDVLSRYQPWWRVIDATGPRPEDLELTDSLLKYLDEVAPLEDATQQRIRSTLLEELQSMLNSWVLRKLEEKHVIWQGDADAAELAGKLFISGSFRLGVAGKGADIDSICVIPAPLTREDFFSEDDGIVALLRAKTDVSYVNPVTGARVPIIEVVWNGIELDVLCAIVLQPRVPQTPEDLLDDKILVGMDEASQITINGPRVTELMTKLVPDLNKFKLVLRCMRLWGKRRGLYSNKMGFLGGVNFALLTAFVCQLFREAAPSTLVAKFFALYNQWKWPTEVRLTIEVEGPEEMADVRQWNTAVNARDCMPIITPAFPSMNSTHSVNRHTLKIMLMEFARGNKICRSLQKKKMVQDVLPGDWAMLFAPSDFFVRYSTYVVVKAQSQDLEKLDRWAGWVESRIRTFVLDLDRFSMDQVYPFPKKFSHENVKIPFEAEDSSSQLPGGEASTTEDSKSTACYWYIGLKPHPINSARAGTTLDLSTVARSWCSTVEAWNDREEGMSISLHAVKWKGIPDDPDVFPDGKLAAKALHTQWVRRTKAENERLRREFHRASGGVSSISAQENTEVGASNEASAVDVSNATVDQANVKSEVDLSTKLESSEALDGDEEDADVKRASEEMARMQEQIGKRTRMEMETREAQNKVRQASSATNFLKLPKIPGIDTTRPLKLRNIKAK